MVSTRASRGNKRIDEMLDVKSGSNEQERSASDVEKDEEKDRDGSENAKALNDGQVQGQAQEQKRNSTSQEAGMDETNEENARAKKRKTEEQSSPGGGDENGTPGLQDEKLSTEIKPGNSEESRVESGVKWKILERGHVFFFYRPKVQSADKKSTDKAAGSIDNVQSTHMLLLPRASASPTAPAASSEQANDGSGAGGQAPSATTGALARQQGVGYRLIRLGKKRMPNPQIAISDGVEPGGIGGDSSETIWSCIADIGPDPASLSGDLGEKRYSTRTQGERLVAPSRAVGRGHYVISVSIREPPSSRQVRLAYVLSHPSEEQMGDVQKELGLMQSASVILQVRNPTVADSGSIGLDPSQRVELSKEELSKTFGGTSGQKDANNYARPEDLSLLDREGVEILMIREREQSQNGLKTSAGKSQSESIQAAAKSDSEGLSVDDIFEELNLSTDKNPPDALEGQWI